MFMANPQVDWVPAPSGAEIHSASDGATKNLEAAELQTSRAYGAEEILFLTFLIIGIASLRDKGADSQRVPVSHN
jgi:hypothetical protein